ncbi:MAG: peptidoglycan editing factor PgeF [Desulfobacterales bacterium]
MILQRKNNTVYAAFSNLAAHPGVFHAIFTRRTDSGDSLNTGANSGSDMSSVKSARKAVKKCMQASELIFLKQIHGSEVVTIKSRNDAKSAAGKPPAADAVISKSPGTGLVIQAADCQAVMLYDPVKHAAANIHSGWRGSISNIIGACVKAMKENFSTDPADLAAGIGPSLGPCCAEFTNYKKEIPEPFWIYRDSQNRFDFWQASTDQLKAAGVKEKNIELSNICTMCNPHLFFSYRAEKTAKRFATVIGIKGNQI